VVVPTARVDFDALSRIAELQTPGDVSVRCFIVVDTPDSDRVDRVRELQRLNNVKVIVNPRNIGAHMSRNVGVEAGRGDFVLFLDDDIAPSPDLLESYAEAIKSDPLSPGFVGVARFPPAFNSPTRGVVSSDILTFWDIAESRDSLAWGVTANLMVRRSAAEGIGFSQGFPKGGGGEDIDYCLRIVSKTGRWFKAVPKASVVHPWWNGGSRQYRRFARWAYGDGELPRLHPEYRFRNAPNMVETLAVGLVVGAALAATGLASAQLVVVWCLGVALVEFLAEGIRLKMRWGKISPSAALEATLVRVSNDVGRLAGHLKRRHLLGFAERFDYFMTGESKAYERRVAVSKFSLYMAVTALFIAIH
jgi:glycosyltransferase involved in cell wall biosynthesis